MTSRGNVSKEAAMRPVGAVAEFEFAGGPLAGRRLTAPDGIRVLHFYGFGADGRPDVAMTCARGAPLGSYRYDRAYDSERTLEHVVVLAWEVRGPDAGRAAASELAE